MRNQTILLLIGLLAACTPMTEASNNAADASKRAYADTSEHWRGLFSYHPANKTRQMPQTRYCYQEQSDIVCYDSPQAGMTAKLFGYQDGANMSAFQPGGGSVGVSGGEPTAMYQTDVVHNAPPQQVVLKEGQVITATPSTSTIITPAPESAYERNSVIANDIAAKR